MSSVRGPVGINFCEKSIDFYKEAYYDKISVWGCILDYKRLLSFVHNIMKVNNFKRKSNSWYHEFDETIVVFNMQRSKFSALYYLNIGVNIKGIRKETDENKFPKEYQCGFRIRLESNPLYHLDYFNLDNAITDGDREKGIKTYFEEVVLKSINKLSTKKGIMEYCREYYDDKISKPFPFISEEYILKKLKIKYI
jgi:hypothetical protein